MKGQQLEMALALREGRFDAIIEGRAIGGMDVLDYPPKVDVQKLATQKKTRVQADGESERQLRRATRPRRAVAHGRGGRASTFALTVVRSLAGGPGDLRAARAPRRSSARRATSSCPASASATRAKASVRYRDGRLWLHDFEAGNGVFLRIKAPVELGSATSSSSATSSCASSEPDPARRARPRADVLLLVAEVALVVPRRADLRGRRAWAPASSPAARRCRSARSQATSCSRATRS